MGYAQRAVRAWAGLATAVAGLSVVAVFGLATPAAADVTIDSEQGQRTGGARIAWRVTNENSTTSITKVEVRFPENLRVPDVYPIAVAEWAPSITMTKVDNNPANDFPSAVVWVTMPGREIKPGATSVLPLAMGPMPDVEAVYFDVIQTRSDGSTETWAGVDVPAVGAQHPAFALELVPLAPGQVPEQAHGGAGAPGVAQTDAATDPAAEDPGGAEGSRTVQLALVLLLIAAVTAFALYWQRRRGAPSAAEERAEAAADAAPAARVPAQRKKGAPKKAAAAKATRAPTRAEATPAEATEVAEPVRVQRRSVVRATAAKKTAGRRTAARKSTGGAPTVTIARRRGNASKRAGDAEGDNA